ncbi:hypothetical protein ACQ4PT_059452 [Festuca glaucescens]
MEQEKKYKVLCLHGFRTSGSFLKKQISKWHPSIFEQFDMCKVLNDHPPIQFMVSVSGSKFKDPSICDVAYKAPIKAKSVHFIGEKDWLKVPSEELAAAFDDPLIIRHPQGHTVPRLDEASVKQLSAWSSSILEDLKSSDAPQVSESVNPSNKECVGMETAENLVEQVAA